MNSRTMSDLGLFLNIACGAVVSGIEIGPGVEAFPQGYVGIEKAQC